jgi:exodeoxyribonuclease V beta subunit
VLEQLSFLPLRGFIRGFIDLVFEHEGRFYVVDYKTNHLGNQLLDYRPNRVSDAMVSGHYFLQYHLYALAVHRYLERRLRGYDYERHFGGVLYLFIKGMTPSSGMESGVFFERPPRARLAQLSRALEQPLP